MEPLTIQALRPSRVIKAFVSQLKVKCDYVERGCPDMVKLENLEAHVANCQLSPVKCSNEGCDVIINRKDQPDHENNECFFRQGKCEVCGKNVAYGKRKLHCYATKTEIGEVRDDLATIKEMLMNMNSKLTRHMSQMKDQMADLTRQVNDITAEMAGIKCEIDKNKREQNMKQEPQSPTPSLGPPVEYLQHNVNIRNDVIVAGGHCLKSVEMFSWLTRQWTLLP